MIPTLVGPIGYTDGSKTESGTGSGWVITEGDIVINKDCCKLPNHASVYEAEMMAVSLALDDGALIRATARHDRVTFLLDNQAALKTINQIKLRGPVRVDLVNKLKQFELTYGCKVAFKWVKGHSNNVGNDLADEQAKLGLYSREISLHTT